MKKLVPLLLCLLPFLEARPQLLTFVTLEAGPQWSVVRTDDPGGYFRNAMVRSSIAGIRLEQEIMEHLTLGTGILPRPNVAGINMIDARRLQPANEDFSSLMIPVRISYRFQPTEYPVSFSPHVGYLFSINSKAETGYSHSSLLSAPDGTAFNYEQVQGADVPTGHLLEFGMSVGLQFAGQWQAAFNLGYITGAINNNLTAFSLAYTDQQGQDYTAHYLSRGCGLYSTLSLHKPLSLVWQNKDLRIRRRIEGSAFKGKSVDRRGEFYAGGDLGSLWRIFSSTSPAVLPLSTPRGRSVLSRSCASLFVGSLSRNVDSSTSKVIHWSTTRSPSSSASLTIDGHDGPGKGRSGGDPRSISLKPFCVGETDCREESGSSLSTTPSPPVSRRQARPAR